MSEAFVASIVTLIATTLTTLIVNFYALKNSKLQLKEHFEEKKLEIQFQQLSSDKLMIIKAFQNFATVGGKTISYIDARKDGAPIDIEIISEFDIAYYNAYLLLTDDSDKTKFLIFRDTLRYKAGYNHPDGMTIEDSKIDEMISQQIKSNYIYEPNYLFKMHNECLEVSNKYISRVLNLTSFTD